MFEWLKWGRKSVRPTDPRLVEGFPKASTDAVSERTLPDLLPLLSQVLANNDIAHEVRMGEIVLSNGLSLAPTMCFVEPRSNGRIATGTQITTRHAAWFPNGLVEFQHSARETLENSLVEGFDYWVRVDLVTLIEAIKDRDCGFSVLTLKVPGVGGGAEFERQVVLGAMATYAAHPATSDDEEHAFCPCCMFSACHDAFSEVLERDGFQGVRLFAARDDQGEVSADCRVNGEDWPAGKQALMAYAETWAGAGFEFRKQYIVIRPRMPGNIGAEQARG